MEEEKGCPFYESCAKRQTQESYLTDKNVSGDLKEQARELIENYCKGYEYNRCPVYHLKLKRLVK